MKNYIVYKEVMAEDEEGAYQQVAEQLEYETDLHTVFRVTKSL